MTDGKRPNRKAPLETPDKPGRNLERLARDFGFAYARAARDNGAPKDYNPYNPRSLRGMFERFSSICVSPAYPEAWRAYEEAFRQGWIEEARNVPGPEKPEDRARLLRLLEAEVHGDPVEDHDELGRALRGPHAPWLDLHRRAFLAELFLHEEGEDEEEEETVREKPRPSACPSCGGEVHEIRIRREDVLVVDAAGERLDRERITSVGDASCRRCGAVVVGGRLLSHAVEELEEEDHDLLFLWEQNVTRDPILRDLDARVLHTAFVQREGLPSDAS